jgi:hypothetical protein
MPHGLIMESLAALDLDVSSNQSLQARETDEHYSVCMSVCGTLHDQAFFIGTIDGQLEVDWIGCDREMLSAETGPGLFGHGGGAYLAASSSRTA